MIQVATASRQNGVRPGGLWADCSGWGYAARPLLDMIGLEAGR